jgi:predicted nucleic acid-binding protein
VLVVDASVAVKWFVAQPGSAAALLLVRSHEELIAPDFLLLEVANAFWRSVRGGLMNAEDAGAALSQAPSLFERLYPASELAEEAFGMAVGLKHPVYDCAYLALAKREGAPLVTADKRLAALGQTVSVVEVRLLPII